MRFQRYASLLFLFSLLGSTVYAQGLNTTASKNDWEEINYEFNSSVLTDGYPSLLRMAELLQKHPDYKVKVEGHADRVGSNRYNDRLAQKRADQVKAFLVKYGASDGQISTASLGKRSPKVDNATKEGRFMNRRVMLTVTDGSGKVISDGGIGDAINAMTLDKLADMQKKCCDDILKRLDRLDEIADMLKKMSGENDALRKELGDLRTKEADLDAYVHGLPKPLTPEQTATIVDTRTAEQIEKARMPKFSIINANAGLDQNRDLTFTGRGRYFMPFKEQFASDAGRIYVLPRPPGRPGRYRFGESLPAACPGRYVCQLQAREHAEYAERRHIGPGVHDHGLSV
jgi:Outer membrane protein and related peptidoglycan-associated (lipo)proteins